MPPVADDTTARRPACGSNYVLSQDAYGADTTVQLNGIAFPVPDLPVGRLVETPAEIAGIVDAYMTGRRRRRHADLVARHRLRLPRGSAPTGPGRLQLPASAAHDSLITNLASPRRARRRPVLDRG